VKDAPLPWFERLLAAGLTPALPSGQRRYWIAGCGCLVVGIAIADYIGGAELSLSILYLVPIFATAWFAGRRAGFGMAGFALLGWYIYDTVVGQHYSHPFYQFWEGSIRLVTWVIFVFLLDRLKGALRRADERFMTVLEQLDAAVYVADTRTGRLLFANKHCHAVFGAGGIVESAAQIEHRLQPDLPHWLASTAESAPGVSKPPAAMEFEDAAAARWYLIHSRPLVWLDGREARLQVATDITDRKRIEEDARRHQEKAELVSRLVTIGEMASTIAHELNQPLAAIANYVEGCILRLRGMGDDTIALREAMEKAHAQAARASTVIQRVRMLAARRNPQLAPCDLATLIRELTPLLSTDAIRHHVRLELAVDNGLPKVQADAVMLEQVILNLSRNALEAMRDTAPEARVTTLGVHALTDGGVELVIEDRGHGIPAERAKDLFEPFFSTKTGGVGLGLHVCRSIAELHGAQLTAGPNPRGGTIFRFRFPRGTTV
jgi:C4-dicarboxylate-specific signal transduction histidine kinase